MRKKLFAILMSAMMMVTFMPSMAFAAGGLTIPSGAVKVEPAKKAVAVADHGTDLTKKVIVPAICSKAGLQEVTCNVCGDSWLESITQLTCSNVTKKMTLAEAKAYIKAYLKSLIIPADSDQDLKDIANALIDALKGKSKVTELIKVLSGLQVGSMSIKIETELNDLTKELISDIQKAAKQDSMKKFVKALVEGVEEFVDGYFDVVVANYNENATNNKLDSYDDICFVMITECKNCKKISQIRVGLHEGTKKAACASTFVCTNEGCGETVTLKTAGTDEFNKDVFVLLKEAKDLIKGGIFNWAGVQNILMNINEATRHDVKVTKTETACGNVYSFDCEACGENLATIPVSTTITGHTWVETEIIAPSCDEDPATSARGRVATGLTVDKCSVCGAVNPLSYKLVQPKHNFAEKTVAPGCDTWGYTMQYCTVCGDYIPATVKNLKKPVGHDYEYKMVIEPTCTHGGLWMASCKTCGVAKYFTTDDKVATLFGNTSKSAKAMEADKEIYVFANMNLGLLGEDIIVKRDVTTRADKYYFAGFKGELIANPVKIPSTAALRDGHNFETWGLAKAATCTSGEIWARKCSTCGYVDKHAVAEFDALEAAATEYAAASADVIKKKNAVASADAAVDKARDALSAAEEAGDNALAKAALKEAEEAFAAAEAAYVAADKRLKAASKVYEAEYNPNNGYYVMLNNALGHKPVTVTVPATCGHFGFTYTECSVCHAVIGLKATTADMAYVADELGNYSKSATEAALEKEIKAAANTTTHTYASKYATAIDYSLLNTAHKFDGEYKVVLEPTFHQVGCEAHTCIYCGAASATNRHEIPKLTLGKAYQPKLTAGKGKITVKITKANKYATGYQIVYKVTGKNNAKYVKVAGNTPSKVIKSLKKGKYEVKVRPYRVDGGKTFYGKYCTVKYVTVK